MALPYQIIFTILDGAGKRANGQFFLDSTLTTANAVIEAQGMLSDMQDDCLGKVESANMLVPIDVSGFTTAADPNSNVGYGHRWNVSSALGYRGVINLPAADPANAVAASHVLSDVALNPAKVITDGIITRAIMTSHDEAVTSVNSKYETFGGKSYKA